MVTAIIGGGAAGIAAAIAAAENGQRVVVLERNRKPLKKLGVTGNGRGNLLNLGEPAYYGNATFAHAVLQRIDPLHVYAFLEAQGIALREEGCGLVYPAALQAAVAVDALLLRAAQLGVEWMLNTRVQSVAREGAGFRIRALQAAPESDAPKPGRAAGRAAEPVAEHPVTLAADRVIVTVGGAAAPAHGTDGTSYGLLTAFGHTVTPVRPALCALLTEKRRIAGLAGQRVRAGLTLLSPGSETLHTAEGEVLFAEDAISGIAAMQLARFVEPGASVSLDLRASTGWAGLDAEEEPLSVGAMEARLQALRALRANRPIGDLLTGVFSTPVARLLCREAKLGEPDVPIARLSGADVRRLAQTIANLRLPVTGTRGFDQAQVTAGGIAADGFDPATMESRLCQGLYAAGEVLDVDGDCGGFNLMFAFAGGILAGQSASRPAGK